MNQWARKKNEKWILFGATLWKQHVPGGAWCLDKFSFFPLQSNRNFWWTFRSVSAKMCHYWFTTRVKKAGSDERIWIPLFALNWVDYANMWITVCRHYCAIISEQSSKIWMIMHFEVVGRSNWWNPCLYGMYLIFSSVRWNNAIRVNARQFSSSVITLDETKIPYSR